MAEMFITALEAGDDDDGGWNLEGSHNPSVVLFSNALSVWAWAQNREVTVQEAALAFNTTPEVIRQAVEYHYWMYLEGDTIEHEGE